MVRLTPILLTWEDVGNAIKVLTDKIKKSKLKFDGIYGIPRGGLPIAVALSHTLGLPLLLHPTKNTLVVDDISDRGYTLQSYKNRKIACLYTSNWTVTVPDFYVLKKEHKTDWIIFPWENYKTEIGGKK